MDDRTRFTLVARRAAPSGAGRALRLSSGLSQADAARAVNVATSTMCRWEAGDRIPRGEFAIRYGRFLEELKALQ